MSVNLGITFLCQFLWLRYLPTDRLCQSHETPSFEDHDTGVYENRRDLGLAKGYATRAKRQAPPLRGFQ